MEDWYLKDVRFEFVPRDFWIGVFWKWGPNYPANVPHRKGELDIWICFVPTLPLHLTFKAGRNWPDEAALART